MRWPTGLWGALPELAAAGEVLVNNTSGIDVSAAGGDGGSAVVWSQARTTMLGSVDASGTGDGAGNLVLQAGRSVLIEADLATAGGGLTVLANDRAVNGVIDLDPGVAVITMADGTAITAGGAVLIELRDGTGNAFRASGDIRLNQISAETITVLNLGDPVAAVILDGVLATTATSGTAIEIVGGSFDNNHGSDALVTTGSARFLVWSASPENDDRNGIVHDFKQYDAVYGETAVLGGAEERGFLYRIRPTLATDVSGVSALKTYDGATNLDAATHLIGSPMVAGALDGDTLMVEITSGEFGQPQVGDGLPVTLELNVTGANGGVTVYYPSVTATGDFGSITPKELTVTEAMARDKVYDGGADALVAGGMLDGVVAGDAVTLAITMAAFADKDAGIDKEVAVTYELGGADAGNYTVSGDPGGRHHGESVDGDRGDGAGQGV